VLIATDDGDAVTTAVNALSAAGHEVRLETGPAGPDGFAAGETPDLVVVMMASRASTDLAGIVEQRRGERRDVPVMVLAAAVGSEGTDQPRWLRLAEFVNEAGRPEPLLLCSSVYEILCRCSAAGASSS